ncbi:MAG: carboxylating nicotinate-nucleotide diphosphorylase [Actinomycetota bacterium]
MEIIPKNEVMELIKRTLSEDLQGFGDITTRYLLPPGHRSTAYIVCKQKEGAILCGMDIAACLFMQVDGDIEVEKIKEDGQKIENMQKAANLEGPTASLLAAERSALNFIQHLSGISTLTRKFCSIASPQGVKITDTRKTKPTLRSIEKYAVSTGGGFNHRFGLFDGVMLKDNHIRAAGGIAKAIGNIKAKIPHTLKIEVEVQDAKQLKEAIKAEADIIMLDNMDPGRIREAVKEIKGKAKKETLIEVSGNITLGNLKEYCQTGIDLISTGYITHSAPAADFSMEFELPKH